MSQTDARRAAFEVVRAVSERGAFSNDVLDASLRRHGLSEHDRAFATRLAYGTIQYTGVLDEVIDRHADRPGTVEDVVRDALRVSAYELLLLRTPTRAAVHQGVEGVRAARPRATGFANALLRRVADEADDFPWGDPDTDRDALARWTGHPRWLVDRVLEDLGEPRGRTLLEADTSPAPLYLRHNPFRVDPDPLLAVLEEDGAGPTRVRHPGCILAEHPAAAVSGTAVRDGLALVTDAAAQVPPLAAAPAPGGRVVDIGAGRGTKTVQLQAVATASGRSARLVAVDLHSFKLEVLRRRMEHLRVPSVRCVQADATDPESLAAAVGEHGADTVLLDAPCTGTGVLRRHPERRWTLEPEDVPRMADLQSRMLRTAAGIVSEGGAIVYATCTVTRSENEDIVAAFLGSPEGRDFAIEPLHGSLGAWWGDHMTGEGFFRSTPETGGPDGHFAARLVRSV